MAHDELHYYVYIYEDIAIIMEQSSEIGARIEVARAIARRSPTEMSRHGTLRN